MKNLKKGEFFTVSKNDIVVTSKLNYILRIGVIYKFRKSVENNKYTIFELSGENNWLMCRTKTLLKVIVRKDR